MKKSNFDLLMQRYVSGQVSEYERKKIEAWLNMMKTERTTNLELDKDAEERLFQKIVSTQDSVGEVIELYPRKSMPKRLFAKQWFQVAATVLILSSVFFSVWYALDRTDKEKLILNDGTLVWIEPGSKLAYYQKDGIRHAELTGEAFFEVAKIPNSTFAISCGTITVKVLGTSFSLKTGLDRIELKVLTGKVSLSSREDTVAVNVLPNEKVVYTAKGGIERQPLDSRDVLTITAGTDYDMHFQNAGMDNVIEKIEKKFSVSVSVSDPDLKKCRVTVDLTDNSLVNTLTMLTELLNITYRIDGENITLSGKGCD